MKTALLAGCAAFALAAPALATQDPVKSQREGRIGYFTYVEDDAYRIWSVPEGSFVIKLSEGETIDAVTGADVCRQVKEGEAPPPPTECGIVAGPRYNWLHLKFQRCLIPEMLLMVTKTSTGKMRMYNFEVHTEPVVCDVAAAPPKPKPKDNDGFRLVSTANAAELPPAAGNLKYISGDALTARPKDSVPIFYSAIFKYPGDDAEKARESGREKRERQKKERVDYLLSREADELTQDPWRGSGNVDYKTRGSNEIRPIGVRDNGRSTGFKFWGMQKAPNLYAVDAPPDYQCRDDEPSPSGERQAQYRPRGDSLIAIGTAKVWRLRGADGSVLDICNKNYNPYVAASPTGTDSDSVLRVVKGQ